MRQPHLRSRALLACLFVLVLAVSGSAAAALDAGTTVRFTSAPRRVL
jgi:hypothetical protein